MPINGLNLPLPERRANVTPSFFTC